MSVAIDLEGLRARALGELDDHLAALVRDADLSAVVRVEEWPGIGMRRMLAVTLGLAAAGLAELSYAPASYERTLRAFANAAARDASALSDLFLRYQRPRASSAYRGLTPTLGGGDLEHEAQRYMERYLRARGAGAELEVRRVVSGIEVHGPRALGPGADALGARLGQGLEEIALAFQAKLRFVYAARS